MGKPANRLKGHNLILSCLKQWIQPTYSSDPWHTEKAPYWAYGHLVEHVLGRDFSVRTAWHGQSQTPSRTAKPLILGGLLQLGISGELAWRFVVGLIFLKRSIWRMVIVTFNNNNGSHTCLHIMQIIRAFLVGGNPQKNPKIMSFQIDLCGKGGRAGWGGCCQILGLISWRSVYPPPPLGPYKYPIK